MKFLEVFFPVMLVLIVIPQFFLRPSFFAYVIFLITLGLNIFILARGISGGIESFARFAMPTLFLFAIVLVIRVLTLGSPVDPNVSVLDGPGFLWNPDFSSLLNPNVWLAAAGQMFFTLSVGMGAILTYASNLREKDDIALSGLSTASLNEFAEVVLGGSIVIPAAVAFFGLANAKNIAVSGAFNLAFVSVPAIFSLEMDKIEEEANNMLGDLKKDLNITLDEKELNKKILLYKVK